MRRFLIISNTVDTSKPLSLNALTAYGRLDVLCRCIPAVFFLSNKFRRDVVLEIFFRINQKVLEIQGNTVRGINPDERAIAGVLKRIFKGLDYPGTRFYDCSLESLLKDQNPILLDTEGVNSTLLLETNNFFIIGDHIGFIEEDYKTLAKFKKFSLGDNVYLSSQTITLLNYLLDSVESEMSGEKTLS